jgi:hypothetical protein
MPATTDCRTSCCECSDVGAGQQIHRCKRLCLLVISAYRRLPLVARRMSPIRWVLTRTIPASHQKNSSCYRQLASTTGRKSDHYAAWWQFPSSGCWGASSEDAVGRDCTMCCSWPRGGEGTKACLPSTVVPPRPHLAPQPTHQTSCYSRGDMPTEAVQLCEGRSTVDRLADGTRLLPGNGFALAGSALSGRRRPVRER